MSPVIIDKYPIMIATPETSSPALLTIQKRITKNVYEVGQPVYHNPLDNSLFSGRISDYKVIVEVRSWATDNTPAKNVYFTWLFIAEGALLDFLM